jgi:hypothetical protein
LILDKKYSGKIKFGEFQPALVADFGQLQLFTTEDTEGHRAGRLWIVDRLAGLNLRFAHIDHAATSL